MTYNGYSKMHRKGVNLNSDVMEVILQIPSISFKENPITSNGDLLRKSL